MSKTIDQRVVEMQFDNRHFEKNVQTSLSTLDKLKRSLNLTGASKGLENINTAASRFSMAGVGNAVETVRARFGALEVMAITALSNITNSAVNAGKRMVSAFTVDPIKTGLAEYETQINAVQTILANTKSKGTTLDDVNSALDELNTYADKTIYNFTEMTRNIGTFTAAGVELDKSVTSIKGIANLAAVSGSTSQQASTAMYQLSQALAAGKVQLMDWNSVVNAGMGGQVFQDALKRTAKNLGYNVDAMIEKYGSFRESLTQGEWLTAEVLTETLTQLSGAYTKSDLMAQGYTEKQAEEIVDLANTAVGAATEVKTFTQLIDTLKEAAQSGWTQTWEIIVGDFEAAKAMWTGVSKVFGDIIGTSAEARNSMLQGWADDGGREMAIEALKNAFEGLVSIVTPIKEAFREIFPRVTSEQLVKITEIIRDLTSHFKLTTDQSEKLKTTFKGLFSVVKLGVDVIFTIASGFVTLLKNFTGMGDGVLSASSAMGNWLSGLTDTETITNGIAKAIEFVNEKVKDFISSIKGAFSAPGFESFFDLMTGIWGIVQKIGTAMGGVVASLARALQDIFRSGDISSALDIVNGGILTAILLGIKNFFGDISDAFENVGGILENAKGILDGVKGSLEAYQQQLKAGTLMKIAQAIALLAASIVVISLIKPEKLSASLGAITVLFANLVGAMAAFNAIGGKFKGALKAPALMVAMSASILILAAALKSISGLNFGELLIGLAGVAGLTGVLVGAAYLMNKNGKIVAKGAGQMILMAASLKILASVCKDLSTLSWGELVKGLAGVAGMTTALVAFMKFTDGSSFGVKAGVGLVLLAASMRVLASACKEFATMSVEELAKGLGAIAVALTAITIASNKMPKNMVGLGLGLVVISSSLLILSEVLSRVGGMDLVSLGKGLGTIAISMGILAIGLRAMSGTLGASAAVLVASVALSALAATIKSLGSADPAQLARGLITIAGAIAIIGIAGAVLTPLIPSILALSAAMALFGVACVAIGGGVALLAAGITALAVAVGGGATAIVAGVSAIILGIFGLIPAIVERLGEAIKVFCNVIIECAPAIGEAVKTLVITMVEVLAECIPVVADGLLKLINGVLVALVTYSPQIIDNLVQFIINVINGIADRLPELIQAAVNLFAQFFAGITAALTNIDSSTLVKAIVGVGLLAALMFALSAITPIIPSAMAGVLAMGVLVGELALVLAAIGAIAQLPGLEWLINEGGDFLQTVGNAIGKFVGGIVGGFAEGVSSSFPQIATDLSTFMTNLQPFIDGAKQMDSSTVESVKSLASMILALTAADLLDRITSIFKGDSSFASFSEQLVPFGKGLKTYADTVSGIDAQAIMDSVNAAEELVKIADVIPNSGGLASIFAGDNDIADFGDKLVSLGSGLSKYSTSVSGIDISKVTNSITSAKAIVAFINSLKEFSSEGVSSFKSAISTLSSITMTKFAETFSDSTSKLTNICSEMMNTIVKGIRSGMPVLNLAVADMLDNLLQLVNSKKIVFNVAGKEILNRFISGMISERNRAHRIITTMMSNMIDEIRAKYSSFYAAGTYLVEGFAKGISIHQYTAAARARAMAAAAAEAAKKELQEHSPSKVGYKIGDFFGVAFVNAIGDYVQKAYAAGSDMASGAKNGLSEALANINNIINSDMDVQPIIRPVLDLSDVKSGASQISGMFGSGALLSAGSISTMMSNRNQNGINNDVVSAINKLRSELGNIGNTSYNINGVSYEDGSAVSEAIKTIVRAAKVERRS